MANTCQRERHDSSINQVDISKEQEQSNQNQTVFPASPSQTEDSYKRTHGKKKKKRTMATDALSQFDLSD
jgi:hypothetical protein